MQVKSIAEYSLGAFCNTYDLHYAIISLEKQTFVGVLRPVLLSIQLSLMGIQFEKLKKKIPTDQPIPVKRGLGKGRHKYF